MEMDKTKNSAEDKYVKNAEDEYKKAEISYKKWKLFQKQIIQVSKTS